jgi:hypothetical protein
MPALFFVLSGRLWQASETLACALKQQLTAARRNAQT